MNVQHTTYNIQCKTYNGRAVTGDVAGMITNNRGTGENLPIVDGCWEFQ